MDDTIEKEKYLTSLKKELDAYTTQLAAIQKDFKGKTGENVGKINQSLQNILQEASNAYDKLKSASIDEWEPLKAIANDAFNNLKESANEKLNASANQVKEYANAVEENCQEQMEIVTNYVKENPLKSLLLAVGAGIILGKVLR